MQLPTRIQIRLGGFALSKVEGLLLASLAALPLCTQAAPEPAPVKLEPIRVTADLWEAPLARIPASVSVYDDATLRAGAVRHFGDLADQIPNLTWTGATSRPRYFQIRGLGENSQYEGETPDSAVRFLVDDFDFTGLGTIASTFDLHQAEVLRGPQAGAFGANAAGGVIRLVTNAPTPFWTGAAEATVGGDALRTGSFALGGPLVAAQPEKLMVRLAVQQTNSDGFRHNVTLHRDTNSRDESLARLRLTWNPNALWRWETAVTAANFNNGFDEFALDNNGRRTFSDQPGRDEQRSVAASLRGTFLGWDGGRFTTVTNGARTRSVYSYDADWTAASYAGFSDLRRVRRVLNQELRLDSEPGHSAGWINRWTLGAFYSGTREASDNRYHDLYTRSTLRTRYTATNSALFGQLGHDFSAHTRLVLGLRAERIGLHGDGARQDFDPASGAAAPAVRLTPRFHDHVIGGKLVLEHDLNDRTLAFASVTRGYKAGGINVDARLDPAADPLLYGTETLWNLETGVRGNWLAQRLTGEVTAFRLQRRHPQVRDAAGFGGNFRFFTANGTHAHVSGLEAAGAFALTRAWSLRGTLALMRSSLAPFTLGNGHPGGGRTLANTPRYGYTLGTRYASARGFFANAELVGRARQFDSNNQNESRRAFRVVNASLGYAWRGWTFTLWAKNLLNERYEKRVFFFGNEDPDYLATRYEDRADPRQLGLTAAYRF